MIRVLVTVALVAGALNAAATPASLRELSDDQRKRLKAGDVLVVDTLPQGASESARGGTALALVRASPDQVWRVLVDYPGHARYYPRVVASEVVERGEQRVLVRYQVGLGLFSFAFHMEKFPDAKRRRIEWHLADGHSHGLFRENSGYWQVDAADADSLVTYALAVRTMLPTFITRSAERDSLTETVVALRKLVEGQAAAPSGTESARSPSSRRRERVALSVRGQQPDRVIGIGLELAPETSHVRVDGSSRRKPFVAPHLVQQALARHDLAPVVEQVGEQVELLPGQPHLAAGLEHLAPPQAQSNVAEGELLRLVARPGTA
jgi:ribosome-associated toxin RatA of RatAB toxin-antitoxin module